MEKKKFLFVIPSLVGGGSERVLVTIANNLCVENEIQILTLSKLDCFYRLDDRVQVSSLNMRINRKNKFLLLFSLIRGFCGSFLGVCNKINKEKPDAVLSFLNVTNVILILLKILRLIKCRIIVSERADPTQRGRFWAFVEKNVYAFANVIVCQSETVTKFFPIKQKNKIKVIRNPICKEAIPSIHKGIRSKKIVGVGRLFPQKNFELLIHAFANLNEKYKDYKLEIYGDGPLKSKLQQLIDALDLSSRVRLMGEKKNVMREINDASLFVLSSVFEGFPNVLIEALASGLPVVSTDFSPKGTVNEIIDNSCGLVVSSNSVVALTIGIEKMLEKTDELMDNIEEKSRELLDKYDEQEISVQWFNVLEGC